MGLALAVAAPPVAAAEVLKERFSKEGDAYTARIAVQVEAPAEAVWATLTDYEGLAELAPSIQSSQRIGLTEGQATVETVTRGCIGPFCRTITRVERMDEDPRSRITATVEPERSDLQSGATEWRLQPRASGVRVTMDTRMRPDFWIPPFVGPDALQRNLTRDMVAIMEAIEARAKAPGGGT